MFRPKKSRSRGFTLVEILCVVVILGIASAIIIPQLGSRDDLVVSSAARVVMADLIYAQNRAISTQRRQYVDFESQTYTLKSRELDSDPLVAITHPVTKGTYSITLNSTAAGMANVTVTSAAFGGFPVLGFDELGSPFSYDSSTNTSTPLVASGTVVLTVGAASLTISVEPYTGEITVQ